MDDRLPAGRKLDARIAEVVMGWQSCTLVGDDAIGVPAGRSVQEGHLEPIPRYSTDLAASWELSRRLSEDGYHVDVTFGDEGPVLVTLTSPVDLPRSFEGDTPALALCRAALGVRLG